MDNSIVPFIRLSFTERDIILSLSAYPFSVFSQRDRIKRGIIYCPSYTQFPPTFPSHILRKELCIVPLVKKGRTKRTTYCPLHKMFFDKCAVYCPVHLPFLFQMHTPRISSIFIIYSTIFIRRRNNTGSKIMPLLLPQTIPGEAMTGYGRRNIWRITSRTYVRI